MQDSPYRSDLKSADLISVIIPTYNESGRLMPLLRALADQTEPHEVIVVDGGSHDTTLELAEGAGVICIRSEKGRGHQLRAGVAKASGDVLLFLHADSGFPKDGLAAIRRHLSRDEHAIGGNFRLLFDGDTGFSRWLSGFYAWIRRHGFYYGDSAIFVRREVYHAVGEIRPIALMEDYDLVRRLERHGRRHRGEMICIDDPPLVTSSRKFEDRSAVSIVWGWLVIHALFYIGVSPDRLARIYYGDHALS